MYCITEGYLFKLQQEPGRVSLEQEREQAVQVLAETEQDPGHSSQALRIQGHQGEQTLDSSGKKEISEQNIKDINSSILQRL